ncbi:MAG: hypothetical protein HZB23_06475 [Deltaproteobacteria bacterium]|nr:hypothetical protein [Deltaproteobacteria bacterium]
MFKEIFHNIIDFMHHLWDQVYTSINDDFENGGIAQVARNKYAIVLTVLLAISVSIPFLFSYSPVEVAIADKTVTEEIPSATIKQAIFMNAFFKMDAPGEFAIGEMKVNGVVKKQVEGVNANVVAYEIALSKKGQAKQQVAGSVTLAKRADIWALYNDANQQWMPIP